MPVTVIQPPEDCEDRASRCSEMLAKKWPRTDRRVPTQARKRRGHSCDTTPPYMTSVSKALRSQANNELPRTPTFKELDGSSSFPWFMAHRFYVVAVRIEDEGPVVVRMVVRTKPGTTVVTPARREGFFVKGVNC